MHLAMTSTSAIMEGMMATTGQCPFTEGGKWQPGVVNVVTTAETRLVRGIFCKRGHGCQFISILALSTMRDGRMHMTAAPEANLPHTHTRPYAK